MRLPSPLQLLLTRGNAWWDYYEAHQETIRPAVTENIVKILSCGSHIRGYKTYKCSNQACTHIKHVTFSCNSRFCPTCGKRATDVWITKQRSILPDTDWQHITFTMPDSLWPLFMANRSLLHSLSHCAVDCILTLAQKKKIKPAVFTAMHTFGRDLKWHVHIHLSVTMGGLTQNEAWKKIRFSKKAVMPMWRYRVISLLRTALKQNQINTTPAFLTQQYAKSWIIHLAKPTSHAWHTISYLGRYLKRPPISQSRLLHYDSRSVTFSYLNHSLGEQQSKTLPIEEFIHKLTQHIPDKGFRVIRYYGILANRVRNIYLPKVYELLKQMKTDPKFLGWATLFKNAFGTHPLTCILCQSKMIAKSITIGLKTSQLMTHHHALAMRKAIYL